MITPSNNYKHYHSAKQRFLKSLIVNFFEMELPKLFGPQLRDRLGDEIIKLISKAMPERDHVKPGQVVWTAIDKKTRPDSPNRKFVPVVLTLVDEKDIEELVKGAGKRRIAENAIARITQEAYQQGALLSMRDIGLLSWRAESYVSIMRKAYEKRQDTTLPHTGSLQDMGTCITHKATIVRKVIVEKKDPVQVAAETNHSLKAVENYLKDYRRVQTCYHQKPNIRFISQATGLTENLIQQYIQIISNIQKNS
ncbi:MAG: DUF1670 domain-containing protein [Candidatus Poribacteria bacterium]